MELLFLGTGTSHGVPTIDCMLNNGSHCRKGVCAASVADPRHRRTRCSVMVEHNGRRILIDVSLDFREQMLRERIPAIDAVLLTHAHADHVGGIPDIRSYTQHMAQALPVYGSSETVARVRQTYAYIFDPDTFVGGGIPRIQTVATDGPMDLFGLPVVPVRVRHGNLTGCFGWRIGSLAYIPDMKDIDEVEKKKLRGVSCLVLNCLRDERLHATHLILEQSMALAREIGPQHCFFVHMCHDIHYELDGKKLDPWMHFAYDGLRLTVS